VKCNAARSGRVTPSANLCAGPVESEQLCFHLQREWILSDEINFSAE
jgi:hypothetical protein